MLAVDGKTPADMPKSFKFVYGEVEALAGNQPLVPLPDFEDALITQRVLEAALISARERAPIAISDLIP